VGEAGIAGQERDLAEQPAGMHLAHHGDHRLEVVEQGRHMRDDDIGDDSGRQLLVDGQGLLGGASLPGQQCDHAQQSRHVHDGAMTRCTHARLQHGTDM